MKIHRFDYTSIKSKLIFAYIFLAVIPILIITIFSNIVYSKSIQTQIDTLLEYSMNQAGKILNDQIKDYEGFLYNIVLDKEIINYGQRIQEQKDVPVNKHFMTQKLISYANVKEEIRSVIFISSSLDYALYEKDNFVAYESYFYDKDVRKELLEKCLNENGVTLISTRSIKSRQDKNKYMFFLAMPLKDYITQKHYGNILIGIRESALETLTPQNQSVKEEFHQNLNNKNIIVDSNNYIVSHQDKSYIGQNLSKYLQDNVQNDFFTKEKEIGNIGWMLVNIIDKKDMFKDVRNYEVMVIFISIVTTALFFALIITITNRYSKSIRQIAKGIRSFGKGQMDVKIEFEEKDELFAIAYQFNKMTTRINNLVNTLEKQKKDIEIAVNQKRISELKALESQINPHFIYNTLDMINWIAIDNQQEKISEMLSTLGSLLRYSISHIDTVVILDAEIQWLKKYVYLQQIRFNHSFECIYDISKEALQFPINKLLLQPAIENAILHGFEGIKSGGVIKVSAVVNENNMLSIEISDNGNGMEKEVLEQIKEYIYNDGLFDGNNIGVKNIINRIKLYYSDQARIDIESEKGKGTKIFFEIPYKDTY
ncbi:sensor histidine kinase [Defluviitalea saccharophila]|uniref:histidine kinase n=1 Tax=Defluviitalea saccharophila TaxID=879970 RepID=A0ABZ2Y304_9FIRM